MTGDIIKAVCAAIYGEFGEGYTLYTEAVEQNALTPCFFVICTQTEIHPYLENRYYKRIPLVIQYLPENTENYRSECQEAAERLFLTLDQIPFEDGYINGTGMKAEIVDGVLNLYVDYDMFVYKQEAAAPRMEKLETRRTLR